MDCAAKVEEDPVFRDGQNLETWNEIIGETFAGCVVETAAKRFSGELRSCRIGELNITNIRSQPSSVGRWLSGGPRHATGSVLLRLQAAGRSINRQGGVTTLAEPGEGVLCDPDRRYTVEFQTAHEIFLIELPLISVLAREPGFDLERFACHKVEGRRSQLLIAFLQSAWQQWESLAHDTDWRDCVSRTTEDLAIRAICKAGGHDSGGACAELRRAVLEHIRENLADSELRTSSIARALNVSARSVQNVFERRAVTASGFILEQRLARAAERLVREPCRQSITELAFDCGFSDSAYFSRCFSRRFGVAPREYRRHGPAVANRVA